MVVTWVAITVPCSQEDTMGFSAEAWANLGLGFAKGFAATTIGRPGSLGDDEVGWQHMIHSALDPEGALSSGIMDQNITGMESQMKKASDALIAGDVEGGQRLLFSAGAKGLAQGVPGSVVQYFLENYGKNSLLTGMNKREFEGLRRYADTLDLTPAQQHALDSVSPKDPSTAMNPPTPETMAGLGDIQWESADPNDPSHRPMRPSGGRAGDPAAYRRLLEQYNADRKTRAELEQRKKEGIRADRTHNLAVDKFTLEEDKWSIGREDEQLKEGRELHKDILNIVGDRHYDPDSDDQWSAVKGSVGAYAAWYRTLPEKLKKKAPEPPTTESDKTTWTNFLGWSDRGLTIPESAGGGDRTGGGRIDPTKTKVIDIQRFKDDLRRMGVTVPSSGETGMLVFTDNWGRLSPEEQLGKIAERLDAGGIGEWNRQVKDALAKHTGAEAGKPDSPGAVPGSAWTVARGQMTAGQDLSERWADRSDEAKKQLLYNQGRYMLEKGQITEEQFQSFKAFLPEAPQELLDNPALLQESEVTGDTRYATENRPERGIYSRAAEDVMRKGETMSGRSFLEILEHQSSYKSPSDLIAHIKLMNKRHKNEFDRYEQNYKLLKRRREQSSLE